MWPAAAMALLAAAGLGYLGWQRMAGSRVTQAPAGPPATAPLLERPGRLESTGPVLQRPGTVQAEAPRTDIMDYLKFLHQIEGQRVSLSKQQLGQVLNWSSQITAQNLSAEMNSDDPTAGHRQTYESFQRDLAGWQNQWQQLSYQFRTGYPKPVPSECGHLRDLYYEVLRQTGGSLTQIGSSFAQGIGGNPQAALDSLTKMRGTASAQVDQACAAADGELGAVCDRFHLHKDFDIKPEGGAPNPLSLGM